MGILETIAKLIMAPKLKKSFEKAREIAKDDPELIKALTDLEGYHERLDEIQYSILERLGKDDPKYDPVEQAKRRERIESRKEAEERAKHKLFDLAEDYNFFCDKSYWFKQDIKDLIQITTYLKKVGPLEIDGLSEFFEEFIKKNNDTNLFISRLDLTTFRPLSISNNFIEPFLLNNYWRLGFFKDKSNLKYYKRRALTIINNKIQLDDVLFFLYPYFIFTKHELIVLTFDGTKKINYIRDLYSILYEKSKLKIGDHKFGNILFRKIKLAIWGIVIGAIIGFIFSLPGWYILSLIFGLTNIISPVFYDIINMISIANNKKNPMMDFPETNSAIDLFEKIKPDLKEFLEIYKKEHIKKAPKLLEEIKKLK